MKDSLGRVLQQYYEKFDRGHGLRREQLLDSLGHIERQWGRGDAAVRPVTFRRVRFGFGHKVASIAAALVVAFGVLLLVNALDDGGTGRVAWAEAIEQAGQLQSVHFRWQTHGSSNAGVEMWWRRPHDFRMEFSTGLVMTGNMQKRCILNPDKKTLMFDKANGPSPLELFALSELGRLFGSGPEISRDWIESNKLISTEKVNYKGEACRKVAVEKDGQRYEYIIDERARDDKRAPFYAVTQYRGAAGERVISHMEVLDVNRDMAESMFEIVSTSDVKVVDRRKADGSGK